MTLDEMKAMWEEDSVIGTDLFTASLNIPKLHSKWLGFLTDLKAYRKNGEIKLFEVQRRKLRYYKGEMSQAEIDELGWKQYQGSRPLRAELEQLIATDPDVVKIQMRLDQYQISIDFAQEVLKMVHALQWTIKNAISWQQFQAGV
jgi:hypothetical protein